MIAFSIARANLLHFCSKTHTCLATSFGDFQTELGDFEIVQLCLAISIASFFPYCQVNQGNIIVDFFTSRTTKHTKNNLDQFGRLCTSLVLGMPAWRTGVGAMILKQTEETTMILGIPIWWSYILMTPSLALASIVALLDVNASENTSNE